MCSEGSIPLLGGVRGGWQTANEINVNHFNILKSEDGVTFKAIGQVKATGDGIYSYTDELKTKDEYPNTLYYRIETLDNDEKMSFSEVRKIRLNQLTYIPTLLKTMLLLSVKE